MTGVTSAAATRGGPVHSTIQWENPNCATSVNAHELLLVLPGRNGVEFPAGNLRRYQ